jgi:hypothetical protein
MSYTFLRFMYIPTMMMIGPMTAYICAIPRKPATFNNNPFPAK